MRTGFRKLRLVVAHRRRHVLATVVDDLGHAQKLDDDAQRQQLDRANLQQVQAGPSDLAQEIQSACPCSSLPLGGGQRDRFIWVVEVDVRGNARQVHDRVALGQQRRTLPMILPLIIPRGPRHQEADPRHRSPL